MSRTLYKNFRWGLTGTTQAMLVESGRVVQRAERLEASADFVVDLEEKFVLPSLTDCHCHILPTGLDLDRLFLGGCDSREEVLEAVRERHHDRPDGWLTAVHYDQNRWGGDHLTRTELDAISITRPILLRHVNGHASVANSAALQAAGIAEDEPDTQGGSFGRFPDGKVNGVLFEDAHERAHRSVPPPTLEEAANAIVRAGQSMAAWGIGRATDMQTEARHLPAYLRAVELGCPIELRLYMVWKDVFGPRAAERGLLNSLNSNAIKVSGVKLFADGAIGSATAAIYGSYANQNAKTETSGILMYRPEVLKERVGIAHAAGYQVATHAIGDYALDVVMDAYEATGEPKRHRVEHAMLMSDAQLERVTNSGVSVCMQPEFLLRFGHAYQAQLGPERSRGIKRFRSVLSAGASLAFSSDRPICNGNPWDGIAVASHRPSGYDPAENLTRREALECYLTPSQVINGDEPNRLAEGDLLRAIVMEDDPLADQTPSKLAFLQESFSVGTALKG